MQTVNTTFKITIKNDSLPLNVTALWYKVHVPLPLASSTKRTKASLFSDTTASSVNTKEEDQVKNKWFISIHNTSLLSVYMKNN